MSMIRHLSHSSVSLFHTCGKRWEYHYRHGLPGDTSDSLTIGSAVHKAIADRLRDPSIDIVESFATHLIFADQALTEEAREGIWRTNLAKPEFLAILDAYTPPAAIEQRIEYTIPGVSVPFVGFIDCITQDGTIVDFKTAARKWSTAAHEETVQMHYYLRGAQQMGLHVNGKMQHVVLTAKGEFQTFDAEWSPGKYLWLEQVVRDVDAAITAEVFTRNPAGCFAFGKKCSYWEQCRGGHGDES